MPGWAATTLTSAAVALFVGLFLARFSNNWAKKQWTLNQKVDIYQRALAAINNYGALLREREEIGMFGRMGSETSAINQSLGKAAETFHTAYSIAPLFLSKESVTLLEQAAGNLFFHSDVLMSHDLATTTRTIESIATLRKSLLLSAKKDIK